MRQPWSFNKSMLILSSFDGKSKPEEVNLQWCSFGVQIHGLSLGLMIEKIGTVLGELIGDVEEIDAKSGQMAWGRYLRVRISINISKPLKRGSKIIVARGETVFAIFKYERLLDFCYICGRLDHWESKCDMVVRMRKIEAKQNVNMVFG